MLNGSATAVMKRSINVLAIKNKCHSGREWPEMNIALHYYIVLEIKPDHHNIINGITFPKMLLSNK